MACGERVLLPAVRAAGPTTLIVADGFSCREQIAQATGRRALHLAQVLRMALRAPGAAAREPYPERRQLEVAGCRAEPRQERIRTMTAPIGRRRWAIAEGYIPGASNGPEPQMTSHETACLLNAGRTDANVRITVFFSDREPAGPYPITVPARRTRHVRFNQLRDPEPIPRDTDYASVIEFGRPDRRPAHPAGLRARRSSR